MRGAGRLAAAAAAAWLCGACAGRAQDRILYRYSVTPTFDGAYGPVAAAQEALATRLQACGTPRRLDGPGLFGPLTRDAIVALARCPQVASALPAGSPAAQGALTEALWAALLTPPPPGPDVRARSLMLSFEATDYTRAEWNFCQSRPRYDPAAGPPGSGQGACYSNDRSSYLTWGPNGATAGHAREVQNILAVVDARDATVIDRSFGVEGPAVRRMLALPQAGRATETYLCGVWADPARRRAWRAGFDAYGRSPVVRAAYDGLYRSASYDGGKIAAFLHAYAARGYVADEVDFAFFTDRAAQTTVSYAAVLAAIAPGLSNWEVRRRIALALSSPNAGRRRDRLGRDMAFYVDSAPPSRLTREETLAWAARESRRASDVGLSDDRPAPAFVPAPALRPAAATASLTPGERALCPAAVLATRAPAPKT